MEEDIKILEEFKTKGYLMLLMKYGDRNTTNLRLERAIENLIKGYRELEKENKHLEERNESLLCDVYDNFIRKSKIKEKIAELKETADEDNMEDFIKIQVLEEILREGK